MLVVCGLPRFLLDLGEWGTGGAHDAANVADGSTSICGFAFLSGGARELR